jgi:filamentous hemagglutinin
MSLLVQALSLYLLNTQSARDFWTKGSAAAGLLAGALGGNLKAGAAAGAAPLLASLVKEQKDSTARAALHGIVAAALTQLSGGHGADGLKAGTIGAITASEMTGHLVSALYGDKKPGDLTADEKRLVSSLVSIAGGLAGAAVTDGNPPWRLWGKYCPCGG